MRGINSNSVDLIYLDPPFNKGKQFHAPIGATAAGAAFDDIWGVEQVKDEWHNQINDNHPDLYKYLDAVAAIGSKSAKYYLVYMAVRLLEMRRILKHTGSIFLHCDPTASHYLKLLMDSMFGHNMFKNEIIWAYTGPQRAKQHFPRKHDVILFYAGENATFNRDAVRIKSKWNELGGFSMKGVPKKNKGKVPEDWWHMTFGPNSKERLGYPTQKPLKLLDRIIKVSSNIGDFVLDPFCGCATTCVAAELNNRKWVGIDVSKKAFELVGERIHQLITDDLLRPLDGDLILREDIPSRTDNATYKLPGKTEKHLLFGIQNGKCNGCCTDFDVYHLEIDHIIPRVDGGGHELNNLQLLCGNCNRIKGKQPMEYLTARIRARQKERPRAHPGR